MLLGLRQVKHNMALTDRSIIKYRMFDRNVSTYFHILGTAWNVESMSITLQGRSTWKIAMVLRYLNDAACSQQ